MFRRRGTGTTATDRKATGATDGRPSPHLIDLRRVVKDYVTDAGPFRALHEVDLQVDPGEFIAVVGRSGSGKSHADEHDDRHRPGDRRHRDRRRPGPRAAQRGQGRRVARPDGRA